MKSKHKLGVTERTMNKVQFVMISIFAVVWVVVATKILLETLSSGEYLWLWLPLWVWLNVGFVLMPLHTLYLTYRKIKHPEKEGSC